MEILGFVFALAAAVLWGLVYTIDQKILTGTSPLVLLFIDSIIMAIIFLPFIFTEYDSVTNFLSSGSLNIILVLLTIVLATFANFFIFSAIKILGASNASVIEIMYPFFVVLFTAIFFKTKLNIYFLIGGILIFFGSVLIIKFA